MSARLVFLEGGSPWGFRMTGGSDVGSPLRILRVNPGSKAEKEGIREGDVICGINGQTSRELTVTEAHALLRSSSNVLSLSLNEGGNLSPRRRSKGGSSKDTTGTPTTSTRHPHSAEDTKGLLPPSQKRSRGFFNVFRALSGLPTRPRPRPVRVHELTQQPSRIPIRVYPGSPRKLGPRKIPPEKPKRAPAVEVPSKKSPLVPRKIEGKWRGKRKKKRSVVEDAEAAPLTTILEEASGSSSAISNGLSNEQNSEVKAEQTTNSEKASPSRKPQGMSCNCLTRKNMPKKSNSSSDKKPSDKQQTTGGTSNETKTRSQIKRMKKREKKKQKDLEQLTYSEEKSLGDFEFEEVKELELGHVLASAGVLEEVVRVTEVAVLEDNQQKDGKELGPVMDKKEEEKLREFLKTLDIPDQKDNVYETVYFDGNEPVVSIPEEIFEDFIQTEEIMQTKEAIKALGVATKTSPKPKRKESPTKLVTKMVETPTKVFYSYTGEPIQTSGKVALVKMEDIDDAVVFVNCSEDYGFRPLDVIMEEGSELSDASVEKKKLSKDEAAILKETVKIFLPEAPTSLVNVNIDESVAEKRNSGVEIVFLEDDSDGGSNVFNYEGIRYIEDDSESGGHFPDDYEADVESALESHRSTFVMDGAEEDEEANEETGDVLYAVQKKLEESQKSPEYSRQDSNISLASDSVNTAKYLSPFSRSDSETDEWKSVWKSDEIEKEVAEIEKTVSVKDLKKNLECDINPILVSKLKIMEYFDDPALKEKTWNMIVKNTKESLLNIKSFENKEIQTISNPLTLSKLAKEVLLAMPNGIFLSQRIGLPLSCPSSPPQIRKSPNRRYSDTETCSELQFYNSMPSRVPSDRSVVEFSCGDSSREDNHWYGMPTSDPKLYVGLSSSQMKNFAETQKRLLPTQQEAESLLDLHQKFIERRSYCDTTISHRGRNLIFDSKSLMNHFKGEEEKREKELVGVAAVEVGTLQSLSKVSSTLDSKLVANSRSSLASRQNATSDEFVSDLKASKSAGDLPGHAMETVAGTAVCKQYEVPPRGYGSDSSIALQGGGRYEVPTRDHGCNPSHAAGRYEVQPLGQAGDCETPRHDFSDSSQQGVGRVILDKFMNDGDQEEKESGKSFLAGFQNALKPDESIVTESFPSVSEVIKNFETPQELKPQKTEDALFEKEEKHPYISDNYLISKKRDIAVFQSDTPRKSLSENEIFKQQMYNEYMSKVAERVERRQHNAIKISNQTNDVPECKTHGIEEEFIVKVRERQERSQSGDSKEESPKKVEDREDGWSSKRGSIVLSAETDLSDLPRHLQEFLRLQAEDSSLPFATDDVVRQKRKVRDWNLLKEVDEALIIGKGFLIQKGGNNMITPTFKATAPRPGVWSPANPPPESTSTPTPDPVQEEKRKKVEEEPIPPVWTPKSAQASPVAERKEFRPVSFESPTPPRKKFIQEENSHDSAVPPWQKQSRERTVDVQPTGSTTHALPRAVNPTVTLLQKAREGQIPRGAQYLNSAMPNQDANEYLSSEVYFPAKNEPERPVRIELGPRKPVAGIGPTTKEGIPLVLRSEVNEENKEKWYKRMYDSLHRPGKDEDYVTVRYRTSPQRRGVPTYTGFHSSGYQSEPEPLVSESSANKYATLDRRRTQKNKENQVIDVTLPRKPVTRLGSEPYKSQPGRIENYQPGHSSISDLEASKWWDEVLEIFDRWLDAHPDADGQGARRILAQAIFRREAQKSQSVHKTHSPKSFMTFALKESGYESDPQHIFTRSEDEPAPLSPQEHREAYKTIQKGGEVPLRGLRKPAPERPKDDTEIEYFPLSPTLTRIRVHKQNITPVTSFPFPLSYQYPVLPVGVCSSYSQIQLFPPPNPTPIETKCTKKGSVYQFSRSPDGSTDQRVKLQTIGEQNEPTKVVPKPRNFPKNLPLYENIPLSSSSKNGDELSDSGPKEEKPKTFADLKRTAPSLVPKAAKVTKSKNGKSGYLSISKGIKGKTKVPLSESGQREKPLSKGSKRFKTIPEHLKKRRVEQKGSARKRSKKDTDFDDYLEKFVECELGAGFLPLQSSEVSDCSAKEDKADEMNPIYDNMNPQFAGRRAADYHPYRSRSFSPDHLRKPPSPPQRQSSRFNSTLRMWSKMRVSYPHHRSRLDEFDSNVKYIQRRLQRKMSGRSDGQDEFGDDVETVRTVGKDRNGEMTIKTNRYVKVTRPSSVGPSRPVYDQNGRRVLSEPRTPTTKAPETRKGTPKKSDTLLKSSATYTDAKSKSVKVTVAISSKDKEPSVRKGASVTSVGKRSSVKGSSPSLSVSSYRSGVSGRSLPSDRGSSVASSRIMSPRVLSPNSITSQVSIPSRMSSPSAPPVKKPEVRKVMPVKTPVTIVKDTKKTTGRGTTITKTPGKKILSHISTITKNGGSKAPDKKAEKNGTKKKNVGLESAKRKVVEPSLKDELELVEQSQQIRTDNFFQNLFLREPAPKKQATVERTSSVLERARRYETSVERQPQPPKPEPNLNLVQFYLIQKRPVSSSKFKSLDRELSASRSPSPCGRSQSFQAKIRRFDSESQFGDDLISFSPDSKLRSLSEPPIRSAGASSDGLHTPRLLSPSESQRSFRSLKPLEIVVDPRKRGGLRARSAGEVEGSKVSLATECSTRYSSTLHLSDNPEYHAYILELLHSTRKNERFRELHKFYASLERMAELEKTASSGDLRPRLRNEEIIDYDRWKKLRTKERAEAELKTLVDKLTEIQKEKDLVFRTADVEAVRWKGDRGLRAKERSVEDLKEQFIRYSREGCEEKGKREGYSLKDNYKPLWRGSSIINLASNLNTTMASHRGRPVSRDELEKIEAAKEEIVHKITGKKSRGWSSLSKDQVKTLKSQLSEIYSQDLKKKNDSAGFEIIVPDDKGAKSPGETSLYVRCNSLLTKNETLSPKLSAKEHSKKSKSISSMPCIVDDESSQVGLLQLPWKEETTKKVGRAVKSYKSRESSNADQGSKSLSESEKKRLSMTLSKEVLEKVTKHTKVSSFLPKEKPSSETSSRHRRHSPDTSTLASPRTCYSFDMSEDGKPKNDFLLVLTPTEKDVEKAVEDWANGHAVRNVDNAVEAAAMSSATTAELESASASSGTSVKTVICNPVDVLKKVEYFEDLSHTDEESPKRETRQTRSRSAPESLEIVPKSGETKLTPSYSLENLKDLLGEEKRYATSAREPRYVVHEELKEKGSKYDEFLTLKSVFEEKCWSGRQARNHSSSPCNCRRGESPESLISFRSRSASPDPTKYYRAYLRMIRGGMVRRLCSKFESLEDLLRDRDNWFRSPVRKAASDPELTRDMLSRFGTDPTRVVVRGQEIGDVQWLRKKYEESSRGRSRSRRSQIPRSPFSISDRYMPHINIISKTAELQMQKHNRPESRLGELPASPEPFHSLTEYTRDFGGYYYMGDVEKLRRRFEKLHHEEKMSLLGQMYTSTPDVSELRDIAPYLGCSWVAHQHPEVINSTSSSPELLEKRKSPPRLDKPKPRPHSSSPVRPRNPPSILKPYPSGDIFANQKFDPSIHRPKYRYQPEPVAYSYDPRLRWAGGSDGWCRHWNKPTVTFKELGHIRGDLNFPDEILESPRKYVESEVTIHYKSPVRSEAKEVLSEEELARRQAEAMRRIYQEERRRKYLQELQDMNSRRHADNFTPSQKSPIPLNRYDDFLSDASPTLPRDRTPEPRLLAKALFTFVGQTPRELNFRRGDYIHVRRQIDRNWCEGEHGGRIGLFPVSYVELLHQDSGLRTTPSKPNEGQARAKFNFIAQSHLELSLVKGELVVLTRRVDENWFEGRVGNRRGIFPVSYVEVLIPPGSGRVQNKPVASPAAHSLLLNGGSGHQSMGPHHYTPLLAPNLSSKANQALHVDTQLEPQLYRVLYSYKPVNGDELELAEGDTVLVMEKCDDGWYVGSSQKTGHFGTFPGNYVQRI